MQHVITEVPFYRDRTLVPGYDVGGKTGTAQIWDPKANNGRGAWKNNLFNYSFVGYIGREKGRPGPRRRHPDRGGHADGRQGRPPRDAGHVVRALPARSRPTPSRPPTCCRRAAPGPRHPDPDRGPVTAACATLPTVTDVDPSTRAQGPVPAPALTADDLVRLTGGRLLARSDRPDPRRRRRFAPGRARASCSSPCPASTRRPRLPGRRDRARRGRASSSTRPVADPTRLGDVTVVRVADAARGARRGGRRLAAPVRPARRRGHREHRQDLDQGGRRGRPREPFPDAAQRGQPEQRGRPAADRPAAAARSTRRPSSRWACTSAARSPTWPASPGRRIGVVTAVQPVHLSRIGSLEAIEAAKGELLEALPPDGTAILNADDPIVRRMGRPVRRAQPELRLRGRRRRRGRGRRLGRSRRDALHAPRGRRAPADHDPDPRPAVGPQRARRRRPSAAPPG